MAGKSTWSRWSWTSWSPEYIENIPRRGYRLKMAIAVVQEEDSPAAEVASDSASTPKYAYYWPLIAYSLFHIRNGDYDKAAREATIGLEKYGVDASWVTPVFDGMRNPDKRDQALDIVQQLAAGNHLSAAVEISLWVLLADADRAMAVARRLQDFGEIFEAELMFIPQFSILREHPDFPTLRDNIGLTEYWRDNGCAWQSDRVVCDADNDLLALSTE
jgi:hypothetical protein